MKIFRILLIFLLFQFSNEFLSATETISTAISDVILEFHPKYSRKLEIILYGETSQHLNDILDEVQKKLEEIPKIVRNIEDTNQWNHELKESSLILFKSIESLRNFNREVVLVNQTPNPDLKFFIYCEAARSDIPLSVAVRMFLNHLNAHISEFEYFIKNDVINNQVAVQTFQYFSDKRCNKPKITTIGFYDKINHKWLKLLNIDKYKNFFSCKLTIAVPKNYENSFFYKRLNPDTNNFVPFGLEEDLLNCLSKIYNFEYNYKELDYGRTPTDFLTGIEQNFNQPHIVITIKSVAIMERQKIHTTTSFLNAKTVFLVTPGELYTPYEKLLLPFDFDTWILLIFTFTSAFSIIFIINRLSKTVQQIAFGKFVTTPSLNVIGTFFGIGQLRKPENNFGRLLLGNFLLFCLVIRNAYQGVMFEMMTKEMRRPVAETFEDLWENNFEVYYDSDMNYHTITGIDGWEKFKLKNKSLYDMPAFYRKNHDNPKLKAAILVPDAWINFVQAEDRTVWPALKQEVNTLQAGFSFFRNNYFLYMTERVLQRLIDAGIPQHSFRYHEEILYKLVYPEKPGPNILSLYDLSHGFIVWLVTCCAAVIVFFGEIFVYLVNKRKLKENEGENIEKENEEIEFVVNNNEKKEEESFESISQSSLESSTSAITTNFIKIKFAKIHPKCDGNENSLKKYENLKLKDELIANFDVKKNLLE